MSRPFGSKNKTQICPKGHDTLLVGRESSGHCKECDKNRHASKESYYAIVKRKSRYKLAGFLNKDKTVFTLASYDRLYQIQSGRCGICARHQSELSQSFAVDHDHLTNVVRGLLCFDCNTAIGKLGDTEENLMKAISYLRGTL